MTNDDELLELIKEKFDALAFRRGTPQHAFCASARNEVMPLVERQAARIRELKAELQAKSDALAVLDVKGVLNGTHVIVPVEPNSRICGEAQHVAFKAHCGSLPMNVWGEVYRAMIQAAQEGNL